MNGNGAFENNLLFYDLLHSASVVERAVLIATTLHYNLVDISRVAYAESVIYILKARIQDVINRMTSWLWDEIVPSLNLVIINISPR